MSPGVERRRVDVLGIGCNTIDHLCVLARPALADSKQRILELDLQPGGQVPTALVALSRWGLRTAYVGTFGGDEHGRQSRQSLVAEGIDVGGTLVRAAVRNQQSFILVDQVSGERSVLWDRTDELALRPQELSRAQISAARLLLMDAYDMDVALTAAQWAKETGALLMLDVDFPQPGMEELLSATDLSIVSAEFLRQFGGQRDIRAAVRAVARHGPRLCAVTFGAGGVLAFAGGKFVYVPAFRRPVVDSTGAGDVFHAGCAFGVLRGWKPQATLSFAAAAAALNCERLGARVGIPTVAAALELAGLSSLTT